ncbi:MAG TPA: radical SAM protein [bacterium]|nr:radical SAM protein [bacterium]
MNGIGREIWLRSVDVPFHRSFRSFGVPVLAPFHISFAVTYRCLNLCQTCQSFKKSRMRELTLNEYASVFDKMTFSPFCATFTGGEPFLRQDFGKIAALACKKLKPAIVMFETCGDHPERVRRVVSALAGHYSDILFIVWISMDGTGEALDSMRGGVPGSFESALKTYRLLRGSPATNLLVGFNAVVSRYNAALAPKLLDDLFMLYPDLVSLDAAGGAESLGVAGVDVSPTAEEFATAVEAYLEKLNALRGRGEIRFMKRLLARRAETALESLRTNDRAGNCFAAHAYLYIDPRGSVCDCPVAAREMGDLRENDYSLERVLKSATARQVRKQVNSGVCACAMSAPSMANMFMSPGGYVNLAGASV